MCIRDRLLIELLRLLTGQLADDQLVAIQESEEAAALAQVLDHERERRA